MYTVWPPPPPKVTQFRFVSGQMGSVSSPESYACKGWFETFCDRLDFLSRLGAELIPLSEPLSFSQGFMKCVWSEPSKILIDFCNFFLGGKASDPVFIRRVCFFFSKNKIIFGIKSLNSKIIIGNSHVSSKVFFLICHIIFLLQHAEQRRDKSPESKGSAGKQIKVKSA